MRLENDMIRIRNMIDKAIFRIIKRFNHRKKGSFKRGNRPIVRTSPTNKNGISMKLRDGPGKFNLDISAINTEINDEIMPKALPFTPKTKQMLAGLELNLNQKIKQMNQLICIFEILDLMRQARYSTTLFGIHIVIGT